MFQIIFTLVVIYLFIVYVLPLLTLAVLWIYGEYKITKMIEADKKSTDKKEETVDEKKEEKQEESK